MRNLITLLHLRDIMIPYPCGSIVTKMLDLQPKLALPPADDFIISDRMTAC
jgi:hypothetical protein